MLPANKRHFKRVAVWSAGITAVMAGASLFKFAPVVAAGIATGAALSLANLYSIVTLVEALAGAAASGKAAGRAGKALVTVIHIFKLVFIMALLVFLVIYKLTDLFGLLAGFTVVLMVNMFAGLAGLKDGGEGE